MLRTDTEHIIDLEITTLNILGDGNALGVVGDSHFYNNVDVDGDLNVGGNIYGMIVSTTSSMLASNVIYTPTAPLTSTNVQGALDQLPGLIGGGGHTQNTDTSLDVGGPNEISALTIKQHIEQYLELVDTAGGLVIPFTPTDIPFNMQVHINSNYSHTISSAVIAFNVSGTYEVSYKASTQITSGSQRTNTQFKLQLDTGGGFVDIPRTFSNVDNRASGTGPSSTFSTNIITVSALDEIKLVANKIVVSPSTSTVATVSGHTNIIITKMD